MVVRMPRLPRAGVFAVDCGLGGNGGWLRKQTSSVTDTGTVIFDNNGNFPALRSVSAEIGLFFSE